MFFLFIVKINQTKNIIINNFIDNFQLPLFDYVDQRS